MIGYFALYSRPLARAFEGAALREGLSRFGLLPHEIAALNRR